MATTLTFFESLWTPSRHFVLSMTCCFFSPIWSILLLVFSTSYLVAHALFFLPLQNLTLFSKHHHYRFSKHAHTIYSLHWLVHPVSFKFSKLISSWLLLFSINLIPHIAFSVLLKIETIYYFNFVTFKHIISVNFLLPKTSDITF